MIQRYLEHLEESRQRLLASAERRKDVKADDGAWATTDILEHCMLVERSIGGIILKAPGIGTKREPMSDAELEQERDMITSSVPHREQRYEAAERLQPQGETGYEAICTALAESRAAFLRIVERRSDQEMRSLTFAHPLRGDMSLYGWMWFAACHEQRHTAQIMQQE